MSIDIIIPIYNSEKTIIRALESINVQTYCSTWGTHASWRVICVFNGCTDNSLETVRKWLNEGNHIFSQRYSLFNLEDEKGIVSALNEGIMKSNNDFIARMDSDDVWYPDKLQKQIDFFSSNKDVDILGTQINLVKKENPLLSIGRSYNPTDDENIKNCLLNAHNPIAHPSVMFRRKILRTIGIYDSLYPIAEDLGLWLKAIPHCKFANLPEVLMDYTVSQNPKYNPMVPQVAAHNMRLIMEHIK